MRLSRPIRAPAAGLRQLLNLNALYQRDSFDLHEILPSLQPRTSKQVGRSLLNAVQPIVIGKTAMSPHQCTCVERRMEISLELNPTVMFRSLPFREALPDLRYRLRRHGAHADLGKPTGKTDRDQEALQLRHRRGNHPRAARPSITGPALPRSLPCPPHQPPPAPPRLAGSLRPAPRSARAMCSIVSSRPRPAASASACASITASIVVYGRASRIPGSCPSKATKHGTGSSTCGASRRAFASPQVHLAGHHQKPSLELAAAGFSASAQLSSAKPHRRLNASTQGLLAPPRLRRLRRSAPCPRPSNHQLTAIATATIVIHMRTAPGSAPLPGVPTHIPPRTPTPPSH